MASSNERILDASSGIFTIGSPSYVSLDASGLDASSIFLKICEWCASKLLCIQKYVLFHNG